MSYRQHRAEECQKLFSDFHLDLTGCRKKELVTQCFELASQGFYSHEIAEQLSVTPKTVQKIYRRYNFPSLHNFAPPLREDRAGWKGGVKNVNGYLHSRTPNHPYGSKHGCYVAVHRLVVEEHLGRYLDPKEVVHHIDDNPLNNHIDNLEVFSSNGEHLRCTLTGKTHNISPQGRKNIRDAVILSNQRRGKNFQPSL